MNVSAMCLKRVCTFAIWWCLSLVWVAAWPSGWVQAGPAPRFDKPERVLAYINSYREAKKPEDVPELVKAMVRHGQLADPEKAGVYTGFIAGVIGENQVDAEKLISGMFPMPPPEQVVLIKAIAFSGLPDWKRLLGVFVERMPARRVLIHKYLYGDGKPIGELPLDEAFTLDVHWGRYFATGQWEPAIRIITALKWADENNDVDKLTIGSMAKWTYATNASRDKSLLDLAKVELNHQPEDVRRQLREVIEAAELFETGRLKEQALEAIAKLRQEGPQRSKDIATWGQAGQTVLGLGCVAAAALGQAQFGIPCVIGGALSTAALKYVVPRL